MYDEELGVIEKGLANISKNSQHWEELHKRKAKVLELIKKER